MDMKTDHDWSCDTFIETLVWIALIALVLHWIW